MKRLFIAYIVIILTFTACCTVNLIGKIAPEYQGVDPRAQYAVDEFIAIAKIKGIEFTKPVTIGFNLINKDDVIGVCTYGGYFREIDLDIDFWNHRSKLSRLALVFHELTHCYCSRGHDFGEGKAYSEKLTETWRIAMRTRSTKKGTPGYWDDGCATTIMHPILANDDCLKEHYQEYIEEMFDRCEPW